MKNAKFEPFWPWYTIFEGLRSQKAKITITPQFGGQNKLGVILYEKKRWNICCSMKLWKTQFFPSTDEQNWLCFIMQILTKFQILKTNLWLIFSKMFEFMVQTYYFAFWEIKYFRLLRPSKTSVQGQIVYLQKLDNGLTFLKIMYRI